MTLINRRIKTREDALAELEKRSERIDSLIFAIRTTTLEVIPKRFGEEAHGRE